MPINKKKISERIKKHEGFSNTIYLDQLGNKTIGYGHLIKKNETFQENKKYTKKFLNDIFKKDLNVAIENYKDIFSNQRLPSEISGVLIEMIFQLGKKRFLGFKKMINAVKKNDFTKASFEMLNSKWHNQTPARAKKLAVIMVRKNE
ncbi:MAG: hypothetical protein CFH21_00156 [Alphaproteobacteria bacterium MarineAlpha5_Bin11]|nr:hypothetical protein [Pelagibacteraceae bacterium]PPR44908.1 MAG: hypothetical protein CFH21_00156 [Alphaproteobacteria bacterium MarineAlpha5_Bin11]PPR51836.1 MAG: hypothetical protein CFH20_00254 [Alphaproteobacteria bacterium MarineAlpha5_Bin10]